MSLLTATEHAVSVALLPLYSVLHDLVDNHAVSP